jgi:hypothetical protein
MLMITVKNFLGMIYVNNISHNQPNIRFFDYRKCISTDQSNNSGPSGTVGTVKFKLIIGSSKRDKLYITKALGKISGSTRDEIDPQQALNMMFEAVERVC